MEKFITSKEVTPLYAAVSMFGNGLKYFKADSVEAYGELFELWDNVMDKNGALVDNNAYWKAHFDHDARQYPEMVSTSMATLKMQSDKGDVSKIEFSEDEPIIKEALLGFQSALYGAISHFEWFNVAYETRVKSLSDIHDQMTGLFSEYKFLEIDRFPEGDVQIEIYNFINLLSNIISNARKHGKAEIVRIGLKYKNGYLSFIISDNGKGIDEKVANRVFEEGFSTRDKGTGLGLANAPEKLRRSGAKIEVIPKGELGGATFIITLKKIGGDFREGNTRRVKLLKNRGVVLKYPQDGNYEQGIIANNRELKWSKILNHDLIVPTRKIIRGIFDVQDYSEDLSEEQVIIFKEMFFKLINPDIYYSDNHCLPHVQNYGIHEGKLKIRDYGGVIRGADPGNLIKYPEWRDFTGMETGELLQKHEKEFQEVFDAIMKRIKQ